MLCIGLQRPFTCIMQVVIEKECGGWKRFELSAEEAFGFCFYRLEAVGLAANIACVWTLSS